METSYQTIIDDLFLILWTVWLYIYVDNTIDRSSNCIDSFKQKHFFYQKHPYFYQNKDIVIYT